MRLFDWRWLAVSSLLLTASVAIAETRPAYGGTLHVALRDGPMSLDPVDMSQDDSFGTRTLTALIFETLVTTDANGQTRPVLAESWKSLRGSQAVELKLRRGVKFHDGTPLTGAMAASALRRSNPSWNVRAEGDTVSADSNDPDRDLLQQLALPRNAIAKKNPESSVGTGPFHIVDWQPGKKLTVAAEEDYWGGRSFLDGIEIMLGKNFREQTILLESGKADLVELAPEQMHRLSPDRYRFVRSDPVELVALTFSREAASQQERNMREALRLSLERGSMRNVLLQGEGQPAGSVLPSWISGYGFVFSPDADLARARGLRDQIPGVPKLTLGYDPDEPLARLLAERIALNARDAGLSVQLDPRAPDLRLVRIPVASSDPWTAFSELLHRLNLPAVTSTPHSLENLYAAEKSLVESGRVIPLLHLPAEYASTRALATWLVKADGSLDVSNAWLKSSQP